ncbi:unnamed protein product [Ceratitis capitata]|uniref:(Mediterranean fruit fly) hypothetical protein n=1 Tax=Ceratitis capitata TaxID=7213 RepID=A0A811VHV0_CERCA|nr:unnamed protein product [Ceratitis capitata]
MRRRCLISASMLEQFNTTTAATNTNSVSRDVQDFDLRNFCAQEKILPPPTLTTTATNNKQQTATPTTTRVATKISFDTHERRCRLPIFFALYQRTHKDLTKVHTKWRLITPPDRRQEKRYDKSNEVNVTK